MFDADPKARMSLDYVPDSDVRRARLIPSKDSFARVGGWTAIASFLMPSVWPR